MRRCWLAVLATLSIALDSGQASGQVCELSELGRLGFPDFARDGAVVGTLAYVSETSTGLLIVDVSDPFSPREIGRFVTPGNATNVEVEFPIAYVADLGQGLQIVDVSEPTAPVRLGSFPTPGLTSYTVKESFLYLTEVGSPTSVHGLRILDVADPTTPVQIGAVSIVFPQDLDVVGGIAYVAADSGLVVVDVSDPRTPSIVGSLDAPIAKAVKAIGHFAYLTSGDASRGFLRVIDVSDAAAPVEVGSIEFDSTPFQLEVVGGLAYLNRGPTIEVVDVSDPAAPARVAQTSISTKPHRASGGEGLEVVGGLVFFVGSELVVLSFDPSCSALVLQLRDELAECRATPRRADGDGDGEDDSTDRCSATPAGTAVDADGCSIAQFCAAISASSAEGRRICHAGDWRNDEPLAKIPGDCMTTGKGNRRCVARSLRPPR